MKTKPLAGKVALVAGATRGAGRGIAVMLGAAGATVYCTGRSVRGRIATAGRRETIEETAEMVAKAGGIGIWKQVDHTDEVAVERLFREVREETGRLDILINDIWGCDAFIEWSVPFWQQDVSRYEAILRTALVTHMVTARFATPLLLESGGLLVEVTDGDAEANRLYRGNVIYDFLKTGISRMTYGMAIDLRDTSVTVVAISPGYLRSEAVLEHWGVTEKTWREAITKDPYFAESESPYLIGKGVVALASDANVRRLAGQTLASWTLADMYQLTDYDGRKPRFPDKFTSELDENWATLKDLVTSAFLLRAETVKAIDTDFTFIFNSKAGSGGEWVYPVLSLDLLYVPVEDIVQKVTAFVDLQLNRIG